MAFLRKKEALSKDEFKGLFERYFEQIKRFVYYRTGDEDTASDIVQDVFLKLWEQREKVQLDTVEALLYTMADRMFISRWRKKQVALKFVQRTELAVSNTVSPEMLYAYRETKQHYEKVLSAMPDECRVVFLMNRIDELKYQEIADNLAISVKTVEKRMSKALAMLRAELVPSS